ncbi:hypothetical protein [Corynebacterium silvaticum]|uniref:hypothetical protein n=1 Tax=Corynebacterium silvaticum TaxID=2320431 RepID=UPI001071F9FB
MCPPVAAYLPTLTCADLDPVRPPRGDVVRLPRGASGSPQLARSSAGGANRAQSFRIKQGIADAVIFSTGLPGQ